MECNKGNPDHRVQFYNSDEELAAAVSSFIAPALFRNEAAILIATDTHRAAFEHALLTLGLDVFSMKKSKQIIFLDAAETLSMFVVDGIVDPAKFKTLFSNLIETVEKSYPRINAFGEMVDILWDSGNMDGTVLLEQLWNDLAKVKSFTLLCGYASHKFHNNSHASHFSQICKEHSQVVPAGQTGIEGLVTSHYQAIADLQMRERSLQHEIIERRRIEAELRKNQADLNDFFDNAVVGLHWVGADGTILRANKAELDMLGLVESEYVGRKITDFHADSDVIESILNRLGCRQILKDFPARLKCKDGSIKHVLIDSNVYWENGKFGHTRCFTRDITEQKKVELQLREAKEEAERANELKSSFLANMSHEIRTPLGAILGFADLLRDPSLSREEHSNYIDILTRNGDQLSTIINDILDLSKVEAGHLKLEYIDTDPNDIAADVVSLLMVKANEKNLVLEFIPEQTTPDSIVTDPLRVKQILMNVIGNAIKFTQNGFVKVTSFGRSNELPAALYFEISDSGIGITKAERERIFEAFVQADGTLARKFGGTGLGLALSRQLARNLGGDVVVTQSIEGKGTTFLVSIQDQPELRTLGSTEQTNEHYDQELADNALLDKTILVVDDSPDNRELISHFLTKYAANVDFAENGLQGYRKALAGQFDVVLMDIQMPEMDGYTATQKLREAGYNKPIIALTAHAMTEVRKKCLSVGYTDHLTKPIKPKELVVAIAKYSLRPGN